MPFKYLKRIIEFDILTFVTLTFDLTFIKFAYSCTVSLDMQTKYGVPNWCDSKVTTNVKVVAKQIDRQGKNNMPPTLNHRWWWGGGWGSAKSSQNIAKWTCILYRGTVPDQFPFCLLINFKKTTENVSFTMKLSDNIKKEHDLSTYSSYVDWQVLY